MLGDDGIFVTKIIPNGVAEAQGDLAIGDRILEVEYAWIQKHSVQKPMIRY